MKLPVTGRQFPPATYLLETADQAEHVADLLYQQVRLDSGDNPAWLPGFDQLGIYLAHHGGPYEELLVLERMLDLEPDCPGWRDELGVDAPYFYHPMMVGWPRDVRSALKALRHQLGAIKWYFGLEHVKCLPAWDCVDGKVIPIEQPEPTIRPERGMPFPAKIVEGMRLSATMLREVVSSRESRKSAPTATDRAEDGSPGEEPIAPEADQVGHEEVQSADSGSVDTPDPEKNGLATAPQSLQFQQETIKCSDDFRSVAWGTEQFSFTAQQAACIGVLWKHFTNGTSEVGQEYVLEHVDSSATRLRDVFKVGSEIHPAWGKLITKGLTKGVYRLSEPKNS